MFGSGTSIRRLRVRGAGLDPLASRMQLGRALAQTELCPPALAGNSVLIVKRLRDPLPRSLRLRHAHDRPSPAWQDAVLVELEKRLREAARPAHGAIPAAAEAVLFADRSELLACLARDWCEGAIASCWWWRALLGDSDAAHAVVAEWLGSPEYAPAALQQLAAKQRAVSFVQRLDDGSASALLARIIERFGVAHLRPQLVPSGPEPAFIAERAREDREPASWLPWVPETLHADLLPAQVNLLGVALLLQRAPEVARSAEFARDLRRPAARASPLAATQPDAPASALGAADEHDHRASPRTSEPQGSSDSPSRRVGSAEARPPASLLGSDLEASVRRSEPVEAARANDEARARPPAGAAPRLRSAQQPSPRAPIAPAEQTLDAILDAPARRGDAASPRTAIESAPDASDVRWLETRYGGVLYLINLGLFLGLYGDFTEPERPGIGLSIWDFLALLGKALVGRAARSDPLWALLAELAGQGADRKAGARFAPPDEWRVPEPWLAPFADAGELRQSNRKGRQRVLHPRGFAVVDVPAGRDRPGRALPHDRALRRWLGWLVPYVRARLAAALGAGSGVDVGRLVCASRARLRVTATHLDAYFVLADLPIGLRLAGLDRDPGWVPAAGRFIRFHFD